MVATDRVGDAIGILGQIRTPAALFAGASLGSLYLADIKSLKSSNLRLSYVFLTIISFAAHLSAVFCTTILSWRLAGGGFDPVFETPNQLLVQHFEYEYLTVGALFFGGIVFFFLSNTTRAYITFGNCKEAHLCASVNGICSFFLLEYLDAAIVAYDDFGAFLWRFVRLSVRHLSEYRITSTSLFYISVIGSSTLFIASMAARDPVDNTTAAKRVDMKKE